TTTTGTLAGGSEVCRINASTPPPGNSSEQKIREMEWRLRIVCASLTVDARIGAIPHRPRKLAKACWVCRRLETTITFGETIWSILPRIGFGSKEPILISRSLAVKPGHFCRLNHFWPGTI